ncbi:MAG: hypothetical protein MZV63_62695 [Marinilabiliales bacterium]|nr:hypothetical protein [Marinilabiliales bacterium]
MISFDAMDRRTGAGDQQEHRQELLQSAEGDQRTSWASEVTVSLLGIVMRLPETLKTEKAGADGGGVEQGFRADR